MKLPFDDSPLAFVAIEAALKAGEILRKGFGTAFEIYEKTTPLDLVTELDRKSEETIISYIKKQFPMHRFLAEESGSSDEISHENQVLWIIDPLDGTMNFVHSIPIFTISIAAYAANEVKVGVIYQPITNELFVGEKNRGAYLNGRQLHVSGISQMEKAVMATGFPYDLDEVSISYIEQLLKAGNPIRILGSAALNLAYVASGRFDVYWGSNLHPWDVAAGILLVEESGGTVTHYNGKPHMILDNPTIIASNSLLHQQVLTKGAFRFDRNSSG
jgi:myo-inositol-1(or 4)-monophosphatase